MNFVQTCFEKHICDCIECLENVEFSMDEILRFLPCASQSIMDATREVSMYTFIECMKTNDYALLLSSIDVDAISSALNMNSDKVIAGLSAVSPILLADLCEQCKEFTHIKKGKKFSRANNLDSSIARAL